MSKKLQETPQVQHVHEQTVSDLVVPDSDVDYAADGQLRQSDIEERRKQFFDDYQKREAADFARAREVALERLAELQSTGFNPGGTESGELGTADSIEKSIPYDHYAHLHNSENQKPRYESGGKKDQTPEKEG